MVPLLAARHTDLPLLAYLAAQGEVFRTFPDQDSGCFSAGVRLADGSRYFIKHAREARANAYLADARALAQRLTHPALPRLRHSFTTGEGHLALVYDWVDGELVRSYTRPVPEERVVGRLPDNRFYRLPVEEVLGMLRVVHDVHVRLAELGLVAVDLYDGCFIYSFETREIHLFDLDHYRPPYVLDRDRQLGSSRFMAPEEFIRGSWIDERTTVFTLARCSLWFLGDGNLDSPLFRGPEALRRVLGRATSHDPSARYTTVRTYVDAWNAAV